MCVLFFPEWHKSGLHQVCYLRVHFEGLTRLQTFVVRGVLLDMLDSLSVTEVSLSLQQQNQLKARGNTLTTSR